MEAAPSNRFIDFVSPPEDWILEIQNHTINLNYLKSDEVWNRTPRIRRPFQIPMYGPDTYPMKDAELCRPYEEDPELIIGTVQCIWTKDVLVAIAQHISHKTAEKICSIIFSAEWLNERAVELYYASFFPVYLRREYSWLSIDLLMKAYEARPKLFKNLFTRYLIKSVKIPRIVIQDFIVNLEKEERVVFLKLFMATGLSSDEFVHHLATLNMLFLDSERTPQICMYIFSNLVSYAPYCYTNRDYGRLLLSLMKNMAGTDINQRDLKCLIDNHGSEFKGPCLSYLDGLISELIELQYGQVDHQIFVVQRPIEDHNIKEL